MAASPEILVFSTPGELFAATAQQFVKLARDAIRTKDSFTLALSGGSTPKGLYSLLATEFSAALAWNKVFFFWGDERHVPPDHPDSNYRMAHETLLSKVPADPTKIFRVHSENPDANAAAIEYEQTLSAAFGIPEVGAPRFDLILLGLGPDGHTASLFPRTSALRESRRLVVANWVEKFQAHRITFTVPVLNHAANVSFVVAGKDKASAVESVFDPKSSPIDFPAKLVQPRRGRLVWMLTEDAVVATSDHSPEVNVRNSQR